MTSIITNLIIIAGICLVVVTYIDIRIKFNKLKSTLNDLKPLIEEFSNAVDKSEISIKNIKNATENLEFKINEAKKIKPSEEIKNSVIKQQEPGKPELIRNFYSFAQLRNNKNAN